MPVIRRVKKSQVSTAKGSTSSTKTRAASAKGRAVAKKSDAPTTKKAVRGSARVTTVAKPTPKKTTTKAQQRVISEVTGFGEGTDSDVMIKEAMKGGNTRPEVINRIKGKLQSHTDNGTPKPVANVFASVLAKRLKEGWYIESSWVLRPPTPQSKAKLTRERNAAAKKGDNVTPISKNAGKKASTTTGARKRVTPRKKAS